MANVITSEIIILLVCGFALSVLQVSYDSVLVFLLIVALVFPIAFFHHSWSFWLGVDYLIEGLPRFEEKPGR